ncbi:MAG: sensor histidine kinase [Candidatus Binatia bacterium]
MSIRAKILIPILAVLIILSTGGAHLFWKMKQEEQQLEEKAARIVAVNTFSQRINELSETVARHLLSYRFSRSPFDLQRIEEARFEIDSILVNRFPQFVTSQRGQKLLAAHILNVQSEDSLRQELVEAIDRGDRPRIERSYARWTVKTRRADATLDDLLAYATGDVERTVEALRRNRNHTSFIVLSTILFAFFLVVFASFYYNRVIAWPLQKLTRMAAAISQGQLATPIEGFEGKDEIGSLAAAFKTMTQRLISANADLERKVVQRTVELENRNRRLQESEEAALGLMQQAQEAHKGAERAQAEVQLKNRDLETLLYVISHDLREPLRAIESFSRMVRDRYAQRLDEKGRDFLTRVTRGAQRMNLLLDDILMLSRAQRLEMATEEIDAGEVVSEVLHRLERKIAETRANVTLSADLPKLRVDKTWATQAFYNLVGNALKFTRNGEPPSIEIAAYDLNGSQAQEVGIAVRDRGPGVPAEQSERIFKLFQRAVGREVEGTGAGLAIVRQIAERHGGRVWVQERPGGGSEFVITFARADPQERT